MIGSNIENFRILEVLGEGGMGIVYKAMDLKLERYVALKILGAQAITNPRFIERFKREAKNQAKLSHPNIVTVYGFTETNNTFGIAMEYINGETLDDLIERVGKIDLLTSLKIIKQVLSGCSYSHNKGFIHRDIKPSNVIIGQDGIAKIMDFGISKSLTEGKGITKTGAKLGTILYMSPEQFKGQEPTRQSDIYSIGCTLYEMILGRPPFDLNSEFEIMEAHLKKEPIELSGLMDDVPQVVDTIINKAMSKPTQKRYHSCEEFIHDVNQLIPKLEHSRNKGQIKKKLSKPLKIKYAVLPIIIILLLGALFAVLLNKTSFLWEAEKNNSSSINSKTKNYEEIDVKWEVATTGIQANLVSIFSISEFEFILCSSNEILYSSNAGKTWTSKTDSSIKNFTDIEFMDQQTGIVTGNDGLIMQTTDSGTTWVYKNLGYNEQLTRIYFLNGTGTGFITTTTGKIFKTTDAGQNWIDNKKNLGNILYGIDFYNSTSGYAVGWNGTILKTTDKGEDWTKEEPFTDKYLRDIKFTDIFNGIIIGGGGEIFRTTDGGKKWELIPSGIIAGLSSIVTFTSELSIILSTTGEILISTDFGFTWSKSSSGIFAPLADGVITNNGYIFIVSKDGKIIKSKNTINELVKNSK